MKVLIACEESQTVCKAFRANGHEAYSCDIQECSGGHPEWHILGDVLKILNPFFAESDLTYGIHFTTMDGKAHFIHGEWDMIIAHPPCTYLTVSGNKHYSVERYGKKALERLQKRNDAQLFFMEFVKANCKQIAIENPIGVMSTVYRKPDQIIQPYEHGHAVRKSTCLWLFGLPCLHPTVVVDYENIHSKGKSGGYSGNSWIVRDEEGRILPYGDPRVKKARSKTFSGIAEAMANQWGGTAE